MSKASNFTVGQEVKNYKEMCRLLGEEEKVGNPRDRQIEEWKRFLNWDRQGQKYIITEIYTSPKLKEDKRSKGGRNIYSTALKKLIMHNIFLKYEDEDYEINDNIFTFTFTTKSLIIEIFDCDSIWNEKFTQEELKIFEDNNINRFDISHFVSNFKSKTNEILKTSLESLAKKKLLDFYKKVYVIQEEGKKRYTSEEETKKIDSLKRKIMDAMGIRNERFTQEIKREELYKKLNAELKSSENWMILHKTNLIKINNNILEQIKDHELSFYEEGFLKKDLLLKLCDYLDKNAFNFFEKDKEKIEKYYLERGLSIDAKQNDDQLSKSEKRNRFRINTKYILPFPTLKKDFVSKQILLCK